MTVTYFASGSNQPVEIKGFAAIRHPVGVSAAHLSARGEQALHDLAATGVPVFVDSGAFSEVEFPPDGPPRIVRPMGPAEWRHVMALYLRLARSLGGALYVVAPDCIGDQAESLRRLRLHRDELVAIRRLGANIIVPIQRGSAPQADFDAACERALGFGDYVRGIPAKKKATSLAELRAFVRARRPARVHLLGLGLRNRQFEAFVSAATAYGATLSCDSNLIKSAVGRTNGRPGHGAERRGGPRVYTRAQDLAHRLIAAGLAHTTEPRELAIPLAFAPVADESSRWSVIEKHLSAATAAA